MKISFDKIKGLGVSFLLVAIGAMCLGFYKESWWMGRLVKEYHSETAIMCLHIAITILIVDWLYECREKKKYKASLIRDLGSGDRGLTYQAVKALREHGWLFDGSTDNIDLSYADLSGMDLSRANLRGVKLNNAIVSDANLLGANLSCAEIRCTRFENARMDNCVLVGVKAHSAKFMGAILNNAVLSDSDFLKASFKGAEMREVTGENAKFDEADLSLADLSRAKLKQACLFKANLDSIEARDAEFERADFKEVRHGQTIKNLTFDSCPGALNLPEEVLQTMKGSYD